MTDIDTSAKAIGKRIRALRHDIGLSQKEVGEVIGLPESTYRDVEHGISDLRVSWAMKLSTLFSAPMTYIVFGIDMPRRLHSSVHQFIYKRSYPTPPVVGSRWINGNTMEEVMVVDVKFPESPLWEAVIVNQEEGLAATFTANGWYTHPMIPRLYHTFVRFTYVNRYCLDSWARPWRLIRRFALSKHQYYEFETFGNNPIGAGVRRIYEQSRFKSEMKWTTKSKASTIKFNALR